VATRRERVIVSLDDDFSGPMTRCVGATALLNAELDRLSGQAVMSSRFARTVERDMDGVAASTKRADSSINQLSGRLSLLARFVAVFGPSAVPVGAVAAAGVAGLAAQFGFAATGALSLIVAVQGVGDALKAVEAARLDPTAANIEKAEHAMAKLAPEAREFVDKFQEVRPLLGDLQKAAARGWFPGLTEALDSLDSAAPRIERILEAVSKAGGDAVAGGAESLAGDRWRDFFDYIADEAPQAVTDLSTAIGSLGHGLAELLMIMDPASDGLRGWLLDVTGAFDDWATSLDEGDVEGFFQYLSETGPKVASAAGAIANAVLQIAEAAAPLGGPVLDGLTAVSNAIAALADSPLGPPIMAAVTALSAMSLVARGLDAALSGVKTSVDSIGSGATGLNRMAATLVTISGSASLIQTAFERIAGIRINSSNLSRDLEALANGNVTKNFKDLYHTFRDIDDLWMAKANPIGWVSNWDPTGAEAAEKNLKDIDNALASMVEGGNAEMAASAWDKLQEIGKDAGKSTKDLTKLFPEFATALANTAESADLAATATGDYAQSQGLVQAKLLASRDAARESAKSFLDFSDSIAGDKFSLSGWLDAFENQVRALASFRDNIQTLRERGLKGSIIDELITQGPAAAQAVEGLANAGQGAINRLNGAMRDGRGEIRGMGKDALNAGEDVDRLGNAKATPLVDLNPAGFEAKRAAVHDALIGLGHQTAFPRVNVNTGDSLTQLGRIKAAIDAIRSKTVTIQTIRTGQGLGKRADVADAHNPADGGTIPRFGGRPIRSAAGSTVPDDGGGYRDYLLYMLAPLEEVISNRRGQADTFRPELKDINAGMSRAEVIERMLMRGLTTSPRGLASGGTAGKDRKARKSGARIDFLVTGDVEALWDQLDFKHLKKSLNALIDPLEKSKEKLEAETEARQSLATELGNAVAGRFTSDLFGDTNVWSAGGSLQDAINQLMADTAAAQAYSANVSKLQSLGLDDAGALNALLSQADPATVANIAATATAEQIAEYERTFQMRAQETTALNTQVQQAQLAALAGQQAITNAQLALVNAQLGELNAIQKAMEKNGPGKTGDAAGKAVGKANNRGAGNASRHQTRSQLVL
jgi:hypothetical protein